MSNKSISDAEVVGKLQKTVIEKGLVETSSRTNISPGHLWNIINNSHVYKLTAKMRDRVEKSGLLV